MPKSMITDEQVRVALEELRAYGYCSNDDHGRKAVRAALEAAAGQDGWQPIETAPKDGTVVLLADAKNWVSWANSKMFYRIFVAWYADDKWQCIGGVVRHMTHWRPLPEPPVTENGEANEQLPAEEK